MARLAGVDAGGEFDAVVERMRHGDERAFREVYRSVQPRLLRYLSVLVGVVDAEDVASETWVQVTRDLHTFRGDGVRFRGWVSAIGRHRALDHLRAQGRRPVVGSGIEDLPELAAPERTDAAALESLSTAAAVALIATLPPEQAEAVLLRAVMGLDARTAGRILGRSPGAVRTAAYRGLGVLAERLQGQGATAPTRTGGAGGHPVTFFGPLALLLVR